MTYGAEDLLHVYGSGVGCFGENGRLNKVPLVASALAASCESAFFLASFDVLEHFVELDFVDERLDHMLAVANYPMPLSTHTLRCVFVERISVFDSGCNRSELCPQQEERGKNVL